MSTSDRLGRGLGALLGDYMQEPGAQRADGGTSKLPVRAIAANPFQPRSGFSAEELGELAVSIRTNGLLQPILVRRSASGRSFQLVAGERRLRAVKQLGWTEIPAQIREVDDRTLLVLALVENIQREDLGPLEEAKGYAELRDMFGYSQQEIGDAVGKKRSTVANMLRLLTLPPSVRRLLDNGALSMGHARAILAFTDPVEAADFAREAVAGSWSVRETEKRVREAGRTRPRGGSDKADGAVERDPGVGALEEALGEHLDTRVAIRWKGEGAGAIRILFQGARDLERVFSAMTGTDAGEVVG